MSAITAVGIRDSAVRRGYAAALAWAIGGIALGAVLLLGGGDRPGARPSAVRPLASPAIDSAPVGATRSIEDVRLGDRVAGRNPIREQVEAATPDPATWRSIGLRMVQDDGRSLQVELLRPLNWIETVGAVPGRTIRLDLPEMGAVGAAVVTHIGPCPDIKAGDGQVVTGKFVHQADAKSHAVAISFEDQNEPVCVTANHPIWSLDRGEFVAVGDLRVEESIDAQPGIRRVTSVKTLDYRGALHNLETTEHVYRVGTLGILVHNSCAAFNPQMRDALAWLESRGFDATRAVPYASKWSERLNGLRDGNKGYRIEFDSRSGGHINVFAGKDIGPHFTFTNNPNDVSAVLRQLFGD
jgi:hypothetical protein